MLDFVIRRTLLAVLTTFAVSIMSFVIIQLPPGDFVQNYVDKLRTYDAMMDEKVARQYVEFLQHRYWLDRPLPLQYLKWMSNLLQGNFGKSLEHERPIRDVLGDRMLTTVALAMATVLFTWTMAIPIGIYTAVRQRSIEDYTFTFLGFIGLATPDFLLALIMMYLTFVYLNQSVGGLFSPEYIVAPWSLGRVWDLLKHLYIPVVILGTSGTASLIRILRANLLDELRRPYVITARAKGLPELRLLLKYPVRVALNPLISTVGYILPFLISGSIIVSVVLSLPTVGPILLQSLLTQDLFLAATIILFLGIMTVVGTLISDILLVVIDPRIRLEGL